MLLTDWQYSFCYCFYSERIRPFDIPERMSIYYFGVSGQRTTFWYSISSGLGTTIWYSGKVARGFGGCRIIVLHVWSFICCFTCFFVSRNSFVVFKQIISCNFSWRIYVCILSFSRSSIIYFTSYHAKRIYIFKILSPPIPRK